LDRPRPIQASNMEATSSMDRVHEAVGSVDRGMTRRTETEVGVEEEEHRVEGRPEEDRGNGKKKEIDLNERSRQRSTSEGGYGSMGTSPALKGSIGRKSNGSASRSRIHSLSNTPKIDRPRSPMVPPELHLPDSTYPANHNNSDDMEEPPWSAISHTDSVSSASALRPRHTQPTSGEQERSDSPYYLPTPGHGPNSGGPSRLKAEEIARSESRTTAADSSSGDEDGNLVTKLGTPHLQAKSSSVGGRSPRLGSIGTKVGLGLNKREDVPGTGPTMQASGSSGTIYARRFGGAGGIPPRFPESLQELEDVCNAEETRFFSTLDNELEKVEAFYHDRETDALRRSRELKRQLDELAEHRRIFHEAEEERMNEGKVKKYIGGAVEGVQKRIPFVASVIQIGDPKASGSTANTTATALPKTNGSKYTEGEESDVGKERSSQDGSNQPSTGSNGIRHRTPLEARTSFDPEKYQRYKKKLRTAIIEFYKELEILKNYRILNITGFKKALKKFEKTARIKCIDLYMDGKVSKRSFADGRTVDRLLKQMEDEFTLRFGESQWAVSGLQITEPVFSFR
jgi:plasmid stabilization system protein ParE